MSVEKCCFEFLVALTLNVYSNIKYFVILLGATDAEQVKKPKLAKNRLLKKQIKCKGRR